MTDEATRETMDAHRWQTRFDVVYRSQMSALYHRDREAFFERLDRGAKMLALVASGAALAEVIPADCRRYLIAVVAVASAASIAFSWGDKARRHADLAAKWTMLEAEIERVGPHAYTDDQLNGWTARRAEIEASEPPHSLALVQKIQNRLAEAKGKNQDVAPLRRAEKIRAMLGV